MIEEEAIGDRWPLVCAVPFGRRGGWIDVVTNADGESSQARAVQVWI